MRSTRLKRTIISLATTGLLLAMLLTSMAAPAMGASVYYWTQIRTGSYTNLNALTATDADHVWEAGGTTGGGISTSSNATATTPTWTQYALDGSDADHPLVYLGGIFALDNTHVWAAGGNVESGPTYDNNTSAILCWDSGSSTWALQNNGGTHYQLNGAAALDATHVWVCGNGASNVGRILYSNGGTYNSGSSGTAWVDDFTDPTSGSPIKNLSAAGSSVWAVGYQSSDSDGTIFKRTGAGSWTLQAKVSTTRTDATKQRLYGIKALDDNHAWAVGNHGTILSTSDGGTTWTDHSDAGRIVDLKTVAATDMNHVWACGNGGTVYFWNGTSWATESAGTYGIKGSAATDANHVYLGAGNSSPKADNVYLGTPPRITACDPVEGGQGQTLDVAITGTNTNFVNGSSVASFSGTGINVISTTVTNATHASAHITIEGGATLGARDVNVVTGTAETPDVLTGGFTVKSVHTITVSAGPGGSVSPAGPSVSILDGDSQAFTITPDLHYHIVDVVVGGTTHLGPATDYTFTNVTADTSIEASFAITTHDQTVNVGSNGTITPEGGSAIVGPHAGTTVTVNDGADQVFDVTPDAHYFATVSVDSGTPQSIPGSTYTLTNVTAPHTLDFAFSNITHTITVTQNSNGTITPAGTLGVVTVVDGADQTFNITPSAHYHVETLTVDSSPVTADTSYTFHNVTGNHSIEATFAITRHDIVSSAGAHGGITPLGTTSVIDGDSQAYTITPDPNYHVSDVVVDGTTHLGSVTSHTFTNVTAGHTIAASFTIDRFAVNASVTGGHGTALPATQTIDYDGTATVNITPDPYYTIASVTDNGTPVALSRTYTINNVRAVHNVVVRFALTAPAVTSASPTSTKPGANVTINGSCFGPTQGTSTVTIGGVPAQIVSWSNTSIVATIGEGASSGSVVVKTVGGNSNADKTVKIYYPTWYLAEGTTAWGFGCAINIANPNNQDLNVRITYMLAGGSTKVQNVGLPKMSQVVVNPQDTIGNKDFSTKVECLQGKNIAVDRTMAWLSGSGQRMGKHNSIGVTAPAKTWYLPDGSSDWGLETWLLIQNPGSKVASCDVTYMIEGIGPKTINHKIAAHSRASFDMASEIGKADASIQVHSNVGVIPERSIYTHWTSPESGTDMRREGSDSVGTTTPAKDFYLAEGSTNWGFTTYVLVQNPNAVPAQVTLSYMSTKGLKTDATFTMKAQSRKTVTVNDKYPGLDFSTKVHSNKPIVAERSMYWSTGANAGRATHNSIGVPSAHKAWYLPAGTISPDNGGTETYTLVQNPNSSAVKVKITYLNRGGKNDAVFYDTIPANSRKTYNMADKYASGASASASAIVESTTSGKKIIVERSIYNNAKWGGTDSIGGFSD